MKVIRSCAAMILVGVMLTAGCVGEETEGLYQVNLQLPADWESIIDMDALAATSSTPYIGTVRFVVESGSSTETSEFPWLSHVGNIHFGNDGLLTVQAIAGGQVIMDGHADIKEGADAQLTIPLAPSGGFSRAGTLLYPRQNHSVVAVGNDLYIIGGTPDTGVIELLTADGDGFASTAWAASLAYPRVGQEVVYDTVGNRIFVFKGADPGDAEDDLYEVMDIPSQLSAPLVLSNKRYSYSPVIYQQDVMLLGGYDTGPAWREDTGIINTENYNDYLWTGMGSSIIRSSTTCNYINEIAVCFGGETDQIEVFNLNSGVTEHVTPGFPSINYFTDTSLLNGEIIIAGGLEGVAETSSIQKYDSTSGSLTEMGDGMVYARYLHTATLVDTDKLLIIGGGPTTDTSTSAEILDLFTGESTLLPWRMRTPRTGHTATLLPDGRVLVVGGDMSDRTVEVWNPPRDP